MEIKAFVIVYTYFRFKINCRSNIRLAKFPFFISILLHIDIIFNSFYKRINLHLKDYETDLIDELDINAKTALNEKLKHFDLKLKDYLIKLIKKDIEYIYFKNNYKYNFKYMELSDNQNNLIKLTNTEKTLLNYLILNKEKYITNEELISNLWTEKKETSLYIVRNTIRSIRLKTYNRIIVNKSKEGYKINLQ